MFTRAKLRSALTSSARLRLAFSGITPAFRQMVLRLQDEAVYQAPMTKGEFPAITVHRQFDPDDNAPDKGYWFSERAGRDSVAFLLYDASRPDAPYGVLQQWHGPLRRFTVGAYTGSLDKESLKIEEICQEEVIEEAGYHVMLDKITYLGTQPVSGQCNEECHLFIVNVTSERPQPLQPENPFEANTERPWWTKEQVLASADWKAKLILLALLQAEGRKVYTP